MEGSFIERMKRLWCKTFGHYTFIDYGNPGGGQPEICRICKALVSTAYSRSRGGGNE